MREDNTVRILPAALALFALTRAVMAQPASPEVALAKLPRGDAPEPPREVRPVTVWVVDAAGEGIPGVNVRLRPLRWDLWSYAPAPRTTDEQGLAQFDAIPLGRWVVGARGEDHRSDAVEFDAALLGEAPLVEVPLIGTGRIAGRVTSSGGAPMPGIAVVARRKYDPDRSFSMVDWDAYDRSDEQGRFEITGLVPGGYLVGAWHDDDLLGRSAWADVIVTAGESNPAVEIEEPFIVDRIVATALRGRVVDALGQPIAGAQVTLLSTRGKWPGDMINGHLVERPLAELASGEPSVNTGADGRFEIPVTLRPGLIIGLLASDERGRLAVADLQPVHAGEIRRDIYGDQEMLLTDPVMVRGTLMRGDQPVTWVDVVAHVENIEWHIPPAGSRTRPFSMPYCGFRFLWSDAPDLQGHFEIGPVPRGIALRLGPAVGATSDLQRPRVQVPLNGEPAPVTLQVPESSSIHLTVHVVDAGGQSIPNAEVTGTGHVNGAAIIGAQGEPIRLLFYHDRSSNPNWLGARAEGYTMSDLEGIDHSPHLDPQAGEFTGWTIDLPQEGEAEVTIHMRPTGRASEPN
jgi:hypothetical protein